MCTLTELELQPGIQTGALSGEASQGELEVRLFRRSPVTALSLWRESIPAVKPVAKASVALNTVVCVDQWGLAQKFKNWLI